MIIETCRTDFYVTEMELIIFILDREIQNGDFESAKPMNVDLRGSVKNN